MSNQASFRVFSVKPGMTDQTGGEIMYVQLPDEYYTLDELEDIIEKLRAAYHMFQKEHIDAKGKPK